jgi:uncharacterized RmlC-like cupin family protein
MAVQGTLQQTRATIPHPEERVHVVKPSQLVHRTAQTPGMHRLAAISHDLVGADGIWAGVMLAEPNTESVVHHHGPLETVVYVLSGQSKVRWGARLEHEANLEAGDFLYIPAYMPHQEINPSTERATQWVVVLNGGPRGRVEHAQKLPIRRLCFLTSNHPAYIL